MTPSQAAASGSEDKAHGRARCSVPCSRGGAEVPDVPDLLAGLWQEAPFVRLPDDAPQELCDLVKDVEDPRRLYSIHGAARRHGFQLLVDRYIVQLREGCGSPQCSTATCFTSRKRLAGKAPLRRYTPTSARTLAIYLASQDHPDQYLCPFLRRSKAPAISTNTLVFSSTRKSSSGQPASSSERRRPSQSTDAPPARHGTNTQGSSHVPTEKSSSKRVISEVTMKRDPLSFSAIVFGSMPFKMLEWLTPRSVATIARELRGEGHVKEVADPDQEESKPAVETGEPTHLDTAQEPPAGKAEESIRTRDDKLLAEDIHSSKQDDERTGGDEKALKQDVEKSQCEETTSGRTPSVQIHPAGSIRASNRRSSLEAPSSTAAKDDARLVSKTTARSTLLPEIRPRVSRTVLSRNILSPPPIPAFFESINYRSLSRDDAARGEMGDDGQVEGGAEGGISDPSPVTSRTNSPGVKEPMTSASEQDLSESEYVLPQTLRRLNVDVIEFMCNTFVEDRTWERQVIGPTAGPHALPEQLAPRNAPVRRARPGHVISKTQWQQFNHQAIFDVLSGPRSLVQSFTRDGKLYDSLTMWYCMMRLTRVVPSLVFHSLWVAARSLFVPPSSLKHLRSKDALLFCEEESALSNFEAGCVLSICFHGLVAAAPHLTDTSMIKDLSSMRAQGLIVPVPSPSQQMTHTCLEYGDTFTNELALRLAKRLFNAIVARRCFADMARNDARNKGKRVEVDILRPLLGHINSLKGLDVRILEFASSERLAHEVRVPLLLLDWARAMLREHWNLQPVFTCEGPFYGALSFMAAMYENKSLLMLKEEMFRFDYIRDQLDSIKMPLDWMKFTSTKQQKHVLDFPFLFDPNALVTYFRSINFSPMCRSFEEASSLRARIRAIIDPGSLVTNMHHKQVLQDTLKIAAAQYMILDVGRKGALEEAWDQLWLREHRELMRPLKVHLGERGGEQGIDSGGVQLEFFGLAMQQFIDPKYGAFTIDERTQMTWFLPSSPLMPWQFEQIGLLFSLALYNGITLPITFPKAFYAKLLGRPVTTIEDISDGWPDLAHGLTQLLEWDEEALGKIEDVLMRTYDFSVMLYDQEVTRPMTSDESAKWPQNNEVVTSRLTSEHGSPAPDGEERLVTAANREAYVHDYVRYLTDVSVRPQYEAFERGFRTCLSAKSLALMTPALLQNLVEGEQDIDVEELCRYTRYTGYDEDNGTVQNFWAVVRTYDTYMKKRLLEFTTASERVPVGGPRNMDFVVQRNGEEGALGRLPTAYTCFSTLLLPEYPDKEVLRERLAMALENSMGFGFA